MITTLSSVFWTLQHCNYSLLEGKVCPIFQWVPFIYLCKGKQRSKTDLTLQIKPPNPKNQRVIILKVAAVNESSQEKMKAKAAQRYWLSQDSDMGCFYPVVSQLRGNRVIRSCWDLEQFGSGAVVSWIVAFSLQEHTQSWPSLVQWKPEMQE